MTYKVAATRFADYDAACQYADSIGQEVQVRDEATGAWREVAACEANDDEN